MGGAGGGGVESAGGVDWLGEGVWLKKGRGFGVRAWLLCWAWIGWVRRGRGVRMGGA